MCGSVCVVQYLVQSVWYNVRSSLCGTMFGLVCVVQCVVQSVWYDVWSSLCGTMFVPVCVEQCMVQSVLYNVWFSLSGVMCSAVQAMRYISEKLSSAVSGASVAMGNTVLSLQVCKFTVAPNLDHLSAKDIEQDAIYSKQW